MLHGILSCPPSDIPASASDVPTGKVESQGFMTGVEGTLTMNINADGCQLGIYVDNPYLGDNAWHCESSCSAYSCNLKQTNTDKLHPSLRVTVSKKN